LEIRTEIGEERNRKRSKLIGRLGSTKPSKPKTETRESGRPVAYGNRYLE
jgi:hypothetical protein